MEYVCQLWWPYRVRDIQDLEQVKRVFTRKIIANKLSNWDRLKELGMYSLQRRDRYYMIYTWKILEGVVSSLSTQGKAKKSQIHLRLGRTCSRKLTSASHLMKTVMQY